MRSVLLLVAILATHAVQADDIRFAPGSSYQAAVTLTVDSQGNLQIDRSKPIVLGTTVSTGTGTPPVVTPPIDPNLNARAKEYQQEANKVGDQVNAKKLAALFLGMSDLVKEGKIKDRTSLQELMTKSLDLFLPNDAVKTKWAAFREKINADWIKAVQDGATMDQYSVLLTDIAAGLDASAGGQEAFNPKTIIEILQLIMSEEKLSIQTIMKILLLIFGL